MRACVKGIFPESYLYWKRTRYHAGHRGELSTSLEASAPPLDYQRKTLRRARTCPLSCLNLSTNESQRLARLGLRVPLVDPTLHHCFLQRPPSLFWLGAGAHAAMQLAAAATAVCRGLGRVPRSNAGLLVMGRWEFCTSADCDACLRVGMCNATDTGLVIL
jgi:hypothetical protein